MKWSAKIKFGCTFVEGTQLIPNNRGLKKYEIAEATDLSGERMYYMED